MRYTSNVVSNRRIGYLVGLFLSLSCAHGQDLIFTTRTTLDCPVRVLAISKSKDVGFHFATFQSSSKKTIELLRLKVSVSFEPGEEEVVDGADFFVSLAPG